MGNILSVEKPKVLVYAGKGTKNMDEEFNEKKHVTSWQVVLSVVGLLGDLGV